MAVILDYKFDHQGVGIPIRVHSERRKSQRVAYGKKHVNLRIPNWYSQQQKDDAIAWCEEWIVKHIAQRPDLLERYRQIDYQDGDRFIIQGRTFTIRFRAPRRRSSSSAAYLEDDTLVMELLPSLTEDDRREALSYFVVRLIGNAFSLWLYERVHMINTKHFGFDLGDIKWKPMTSQWGSCNTRDHKIHLATRLLLAPVEVIDSVIIHELAHIQHPNHSPAFWQTVKEVLPDYETHDQWLRDHGLRLKFVPVSADSIPGEPKVIEPDTPPPDAPPAPPNGPTPPTGRQLDLFEDM